MPKSLAELKNAKRGVKKAGGRKIVFAPIVQSIVASGLYYTVKEVHETLVKKQVSRFRTMKLLNNAVAGHRLTRLYENGRFYYGKPE